MARYLYGEPASATVSSTLACCERQACRTSHVPFCCPDEDGGHRRPRLPHAAMQRAKALKDAQRVPQAVPGVAHPEVLVGHRHDAVDNRCPVPCWCNVAPLRRRPMHSARSARKAEGAALRTCSSTAVTEGADESTSASGTPNARCRPLMTPCTTARASPEGALRSDHCSHAFLQRRARQNDGLMPQKSGDSRASCAVPPRRAVCSSCRGA